MSWLDWVFIACAVVNVPFLVLATHGAIKFFRR